MQWSFRFILRKYSLRWYIISKQRGGGIVFFTLEDALNLDCLKDTKVVAGHFGINREIRYVNVMEVPDIENWMSEYELLLTTGYPFKDKKTNWKELLFALHQKKLTAIAIKPDRFIKKIPDELIEAANDLEIPILELHADARFDLIIRDVLRGIINYDYKLIKEGEEIHRLFTNLILSGGDLKEILWILAKTTNSKVSLINADGYKVEETAIYSEDDSIILLNNDMANNEEVTRPICISSEIEAYINMVSLKGKFSETDMVAVDRAVEAISMIFLKRIAAREIEKGYRNDFLNDVIDGEVESKDVLMERGKFFGIDFNLSYILFYIDIDSFEEVFLKKLKRDEKKSHSLMEDLFKSVFTTFFSKAKDSIIWERSDSIIVLYPAKEYITKDSEGNVIEKNLKENSLSLAKQIKDKIDDHIKDFTISIGIGSFYPDVMDISKSYREAQEAIRLGKLIWGNNRVYHYDDLGIYKILMQCDDRHELQVFVNKTIGRLLEYDKKKNTQFYTTLEYLIKNDFNLKIVGEKLFIHPKTVSYRKKKIEEILGISLDNMEERFSVFIALKIRDIIDM